MARPVLMSRDEAELLDDLLLKHAAQFTPDSIPAHVIQVASELCNVWGMVYWWDRADPVVTRERWAMFAEKAPPTRR